MVRNTLSGILICLFLSGCVTPRSKTTIYPKDEDGVRVILIEQDRLGKTTVDADGVKASYDSKGDSVLKSVTDTVAEVGKIIMLDKVLDD